MSNERDDENLAENSAVDNVVDNDPADTISNATSADVSDAVEVPDNVFPRRRVMMGWLILVVVLAMGYVSLGLYLYATQRSFLYHPTPFIAHGHDDLLLDNNGVAINVIKVNPGQKKALVYFGGNAEAVAVAADRFKTAFPEHTVYLMNYRGYGGSGGAPSEQSLYQDAQLLMAHVKAQHHSISVMGRSLGSGVATWLAAQETLQSLVLITPYDSIAAVAQRLLPIYPMQWMMKDTYPSVQRAADIREPTLIVMAKFDKVIPNESTYRLASAFDKNLLMRTVSGYNHDTLLDAPEILPEIRTFLNEARLSAPTDKPHTEH